jgi:hypothetical protein
MRHRRKPAEVAALFDSFVQSGMSVGDYCLAHRVPRSSLSAIVNRRRAVLPDSSLPSSFVPVEIVAETVRRQPSSTALAVELADGMRIIVERDFDSATLLRLIATLGQR